MKLHLPVYNDHLADMINRYQCKNAKNTINIWHLRCTYNYIDHKNKYLPAYNEIKAGVVDIYQCQRKKNANYYQPCKLEKSY